MKYSLLSVVALFLFGCDGDYSVPVTDTENDNNIHLSQYSSLDINDELHDIENRLNDDDSSDDAFLSMVKEAGGFAKFADMMSTSDEAWIASFHDKHGLTYEVIDLTKDQSSESIDSINHDRQFRKYSDLYECMKFFPKEDRNKTFYLKTTYSNLSGWQKGHRVHIDHKGRPLWASLAFGSFEQIRRTVRDADCNKKTRQWGGYFSSDQGGHLIPVVMGGWRKRSNLIPQNSNLNQGIWSKLEQKISSECINGGARGTYSVEVRYPNNNTIRPSSLSMILNAYSPTGIRGGTQRWYNVPNMPVNPNHSWVRWALHHYGLMWSYVDLTCST